MNFGQQGDVLIEKASIPKDAKELGHRTLAEGEATGHAHRASAGTLLESGQRRFLRVPKGGATVAHEEHKPVTLPAGEYEVRIVREYDHFAEEARAVRD